MTASSVTSNDLEKQDTVDAVDTEKHDTTASSVTSNDLEKQDTVDAVDTEKHDTTASSATSNDTEKHDTIEKETIPPADAFESPLQQAYQAGEWTSPEDPENPLNWSKAKKAYHAALVSLYCFEVYVEDTPKR